MPTTYIVMNQQHIFLEECVISLLEHLLGVFMNKIEIVFFSPSQNYSNMDNA